MIATDRNTDDSINPLAGLGQESKIVLYRTLTKLFDKPDEEGFLLEGSFHEWCQVQGVPDDGREASRRKIVQKVQALRSNANSYTVTMRPDVAAFIAEAEEELKRMAEPVLLELREMLRADLNGLTREYLNVQSGH